MGTVRVGFLDTLNDCGVVIGDRRGFFEEQRLALVRRSYQSPSQLLSAIVTGQVDAAVVPVGASLFNALADGAEIRLVAEASGSPPGNGAAGLILRPDLWSKVSYPTDLRGSRVGLLGRGDSREVELAALLKQGWLARSDVEPVLLSSDDLATGLAEGALDAAMVSEPILSDLERNGLGRVWRRSDQIVPNHLNAVLVFTTVFGRNRPDVARRFLTGYLKAVRLYNTDYVRGSGLSRAATGAVLVQSGLLPDWDDLNRLTLPGINPNGMVNLPSLRQDQHYFFLTGQLRREVELPTYVDAQFTAHAILQLGEYR